MKKFFISLNPWMKAVVIFFGLIFFIIVMNHILFPTPKESLVSFEPELTFGDLDNKKAPSLAAQKNTQSVTSRAALSAPPTALTPDAKPAPAAEPAPSLKNPAQLSGNFYSIQIASLRENSYAQELAAKLHKEGYNADIVVRDLKEKGIWNIVFVGRYATESEAEKGLAEFKKQYKDSFIKFRKARSP